jgi:hypothetical protein
MNKQRKTSHILNVFQYDETTGAVTLPSTLVLTAPAGSDNSTKVPTTAWTRSYISSLGYVTGNQSISITGDATGSGSTSIELTLANTAVTPGTYGSATLVPVVTVDSKGRITSVTTASISGALTFTGDVTGTGTTGSSTTLTLANSGVTAGTYTKVTVDSKGRVTVGASATTSDIAEGTNLYYTDARVLAYLTANNYATQSYVGTQINNLVAGAPGLLDTLDELAAALGDDANFATTTATSLGNRLRIDTAAQGLTSTQQGYGRTNLGLGSAALSSTGDFATAAQGTKADTAFGWGNHASAGYLTSATAATTYASLTGSYANPSWITSLAYSKITGVPAFLTSYTETDPYRVTAVAVSGTSTKTITITRADASTVTTTWTDYDTDTNTYASSLGFSGGTLTLTNNNASTVTVSLDGRYLQSYSETDTLATVTGRGATTNTETTYYGGLRTRKSQTAGNYTTAALWTESYDNTATGIAFHISGVKGTFLEMRTNQVLYWDGNTVYHSGNLTNLNQLTNGPGYITSYSETDTLNSVTSRGNTTSNSVRFGANVDISPTNSAFRFYDGTTFRGGFGLDSWGHGGSDANLVLYVNGDNTLFFSTNGTKRASLTSSAFNSLVALQQSGNQVLHAGNYSSYAFPASGGTLNGYLTVSANWATSPYTSALTIIGTYPSITFRGSNSDWEWLQHVDSVGNFHFYGGAGYTANNWSNKLSIKTSGQLILKNHSTGDSGYDNPLWIWATADSDAIVIQNTTSGGTPPKIYFRDTNGIIQTGNSEIRLRTSNSNSYSAYLSGGDWYATGSMRAPIFYDTDDTSYYLNPHSTSELRNLYLGAHDSGASEFLFGENSSGWYGMRWYWDSGVNFYWYGRNAGTDTLIMNYTTNDNSYAKWHRHFHMNSYNIDYVSQIYMNGGVYISTNNNRNLQVKSSGAADCGILGRGNGDQFAFQLYGSGGDYGFLDGVWAAWDIRKTVDGAMYMNDNNSYYLYTNSTSTSLSIAGKITTAVSNGTIISHGSMTDAFGYNNSYGTYIGSVVGGTYYIYANGTFYDAGTMRTFIHSGNISSQSVNSSYRGIIEDTRGGQRSPNDYDDYRVSWEFTNQIVSGWHSVMTLQGWHNGYAAWQIIGPSDSAHENWYLRSGNNTSWNSLRSIIHSGNIASQTVSNSDMVDGYHASNFLGFQGNSYYQANTWIQLNGYHGLYAPSANGAHWMPNNASTYTTWRIAGSRNSYSGVYDDYSGVNMLMFDSGGNGGAYRENNGRWYWYHHLSNNCTGISTSSTSSSYRAYIGGALYAEGDIVAYSDVRKKTDIVTIDNALEKVINLRGVYYTRIDDTARGRQTGVIAQEINEVLPEVVTYAADVDEYGVSYGNIVGVLIEAIKEQQTQIEDLKNKLDLLTQNK